MKKSTRFSVHLVTACLFIFLMQVIKAEVWVVAQKAVGASDENPGSADKPFRTINAAAQKAVPGDTIEVQSGIYRERVIPASGGSKDAPIIYRVAPGAKVQVKGSEEWRNPWTPLEGLQGVYISKIDAKWFKGARNPYITTISVASSDISKAARPIATSDLEKPWSQTLGQVFADGEPLTQVESMAELGKTDHAWIVSATGEEILVRMADGTGSPEAFSIEWSVRDRIFAPYRRGLGYIHVRGFHFEHCANQGPFPQGGAVSMRSGRHWVIEDNTIRYAKTIGLDVGSETWRGESLRDTHEKDKRLIVQSSHLVRNNTISDNGLCGIAGWSSPGVKIYNNLIERNNRLHFSRANSSWEEWAGIKLHATNAVIAGNIVRDNHAHGIWLDNDYNGARITGNTILGNRGSGVFLELGAGSVLVDQNIIAETAPMSDFFGGNGIYCHDASGVRAVHNLLMENAGYGVLMRAITTRKIWGSAVCASNEIVANNIFVENGTGATSLPFPNSRGDGNWSDGNLYLMSKDRMEKGRPFHLNKYQGKFSWDEPFERMIEISGGTPTSVEVWSKKPDLTFRQWRHILKWDTDSQVGELGQVELDSEALHLALVIPDAIHDTFCLPIAEVNRDFTGREFPEEGILPGPFQSLAVGENQHSIEPLELTEPPMLRRRGGESADGESQLLAEFKSEIKAIPAVNEKGFSTTIAVGGAQWFQGYQKRENAELNEPFRDFGHLVAPKLSARSSKGVSTGPAQSLLYRVEQDTRAEVQIAGVLSKRTASTAGIARVEIYQLDARREAGVLLETIDLNTRGGYRAEVLPDRFDWSGTVSAPRYSYIGVRFQIVAPGPAPAGQGWLDIETFSVSAPVEQ